MPLAVGQTRPDFDPRFQFFLSQGYAILAPNVRGSSGYGKTCMALDDVHLRMDSVADLKYAVEWLRASGVADPSRVAIYGRSYGGFMMLAAITAYPDLWAAAIDVVGIANWITFLENTGPWRRAHREQEYGSLEQDRAFLESTSPIHQVDRIQAPLLVMHGANDPRVPVTETDEIVAHLRRRDHPVEYLRYAEKDHKISKLANRVDSYKDGRVPGPLFVIRATRRASIRFGKLVRFLTTCHPNCIMAVPTRLCVLPGFQPFFREVLCIRLGNLISMLFRAIRQGGVA
jgi:dipeptidyl aminopeptidase/acylaminoacyl peptidase